MNLPTACVSTGGDLFLCVCVTGNACVCPVLQAGKVPVFAVPKSWRGHPVRLCLVEFVLLWEFPIGARGAGLLHWFHQIFIASLNSSLSILLLYLP